MIIDITSLKSNIVSKIEICESLSVDENLLNDSKILDLKETIVEGTIIKDNLDEYIIDVNVKGTMVLEDSITLDPIDYDFETHIEGNIDELLEEINLISKKTEFSIDIFPIIWENILMEVPIRFTNGENIKIEGNGWKFVSEEETSSSTNPEFEKLKDLFK